MLVLSRREDEVIDGLLTEEELWRWLDSGGGDLRFEVRVLSIRGDKVRLGIDAPREMTVHRREVMREVEASGRPAA